MKKTYIVSIIFLMALFISCKSTGEKALKRGDYYTANLQAIEKLRSSPDNEKARETLNEAYPLAVQYTENEVGRLLASYGDNRKYLKVYELYKQMNEIAYEISRSPAALNIIPLPDYYNSQLESARERAAEETYRRAEERLGYGSRNSAKEAYYLYRQVYELDSRYADVVLKMREAKDRATLKIVIEQEPVGGEFKISADFFQNNVFQNLSNTLNGEFRQVYSPEEAEQVNLVPDHILQLRFNNFVVGQMRESQRKMNVKRDSVVIGTVKDRRGGEQNVYGTVKATITIRKREVASSGNLLVSIVDYRTRKTIGQTNIPGSYVWVDEWGSFNGDERALTRAQLAMCNREPLLPPPPQELFVQFTIPIFNNLSAFISNFYRGFKDRD